MLFGTIGFGILAITLGVLGLFLVSGLLRWIWNTTVPEIFGLRPLRYWQAFRLLVLSTILTGGLLH